MWLEARPRSLEPGSGLLGDGPRIPLDVWSIIAGRLGEFYNQVKQ